MKEDSRGRWKLGRHGSDKNRFPNPFGTREQFFINVYYSADKFGMNSVIAYKQVDSAERKPGIQSWFCKIRKLCTV